MNILILGKRSLKSLIYKKRKTVKTVIINSQTNKVLLLSNLLLGGGVEKYETHETALHREILEESGMKVTITKYLGRVIQYRDFLKKRYVISGYLSEYICTLSSPTSEDMFEKMANIGWSTLEEAIKNVESEIVALLDKNSGNTLTDAYQAALYNRQTTVFFLKKAKDKISYLPKL